MGDRTAIEWTDATWNPIVGCSKVSPGCDNCYAIGVAHRGMTEHHRGLTIRVRNGDSETTEWNGEIHRAPDSIFMQPLRWQRPRRIFVNSLSDLFHPGVSDGTITEIVAVMALAQQHTFQVLTKRPQRMAALLNDEGFHHDLRDMIGWLRDRFRSDQMLVNRPWPPPNVWWGVSTESNRYAWRADHLRDTPAAVRWVSAEPLLGPLDQLNLTGIDWVVAGGESGPGARPMHPQWARDLRDRCADDGIAFHFKQWGSWAPWIADDWSEEAGGSTYVKLDGSTSWAAGSDDSCTNWSANYEPSDHAVTQTAKSAAGRTLDGRTWDEYPQ